MIFSPYVYITHSYTQDSLNVVGEGNANSLQNAQKSLNFRTKQALPLCWGVYSDTFQVLFIRRGILTFSKKQVTSDYLSSESKMPLSTVANTATNNVGQERLNCSSGKQCFAHSRQSSKIFSSFMYHVFQHQLESPSQAGQEVEPVTSVSKLP